MTKENIEQEFRLKYIGKKNCFIEEIKHNKVFKISSYTEHLLIFVSTVTGCVLISAFASVVCIFLGIASSTSITKVSVITKGIKKYKSIIKKKELYCYCYY